MSIDDRRSVGADRLRAAVLEPVIPARPGQPARCTVRVFNDGDRPVEITVRVHGLGPSRSTIGPTVPQGGSIDFTLPLRVPESFGVGSHAVAVEVTSAVHGERPALAQCTLSISALDHIVTRIEPSVISGGRRAKFRVEVQNRTHTPATVELEGSGPTLDVSLATRRITMPGGATALVAGRVRGPRRITGDPVQHVLTVETRSNSTPRYTTAAYRQRALLPRRIRSGMLALSIVLVWAAIAVGAIVWWSGRSDEPAADDAAGAQVVDADGDGVPDATAAGDEAGGDAGTNGQDSGSDGTGSGGTEGSGEGSGDGAAAADVPTSAIVRGTVKAGTTGADDGVMVTLTPTTPGGDTVVGSPAASAEGAAASLGSGASGSGATTPMVSSGFASAPDLGAAPAPDAESDEPTKSWPARVGNYRASGLNHLRTVSVASQSSSIDGSWQFSEVPLHQTYELSFSKAGFNTKSYIVSPPEDGEPVELEVELAPADGELGGAVTGLGDAAAEVVVTDGTLTFSSTTSTDAADRGAWRIAGVSTPGTYSITFTSEGFGTEVMVVALDAGATRTDLSLEMLAGVGSISGTVTADGGRKGGVTLTATAGDTTISTSSLTQGAQGTYTFPQLALGSVFTLTASADGYITQTLSRTVNGNVTGVDFSLVRSTASVIGRVMSERDGAVTSLVSAAVSVKADELEVRTSSAASPVAGSFRAGDLPPGSYVVTISRYDHPAVTQLVDLVAGQVLDLGEVVLTYRAPPTLTATGSVTIRTVDAFGQPLNGATAQLIDVAGRIAPVSKTMPGTENAVQFTAVPIGTYRVRVTKADYRPGTIEQLSVGLGAVERQVVLLQFGTARGSVVDAAAGYRDPSPGLVDDRGQPVYATRSGVKVYVDPRLPIEIPPVSKVGTGAVAAFLDAAGRLVVRYDSGALLLDLIGNDGIPDEPLTPVTEKVGKVLLRDYELLLYRLNGTARVCVGVLAAEAEDGQWTIEPDMQIVTGSYVLRFTPLAGEVATECSGRGTVPKGFAAIPRNADGDVAAFEIPANLDQRVVVDPIPVAPYPSVSGRVLIPRVDAGAVVFDGFAGAVASGLSVTLDCGNDRTLVATLTESASARNTPGATSFELPRSAVADLLAGVPYDGATGALPVCSLRAAATGGDFIPVTVDVPLAVGLAPPYPDRVVNIALVDDPTVIVGSVRWHDQGAKGGEPSVHVVPGALVAADDEVVVAFAPSNDADPDGPTGSTVAGADPTAVMLAVSQRSDVVGQWAFAVTGRRQLLGTERYTVGADHFQPAQLDIAATGVGWTASAVAPARVDFTANSAGGGVADVFLQPLPGSLAGEVQITSIRGQAAIGEVAMLATTPGASTGAGVAVVAGRYTIDPAIAGTWQLDFGPADAATSNLHQAGTRAFVGPQQAAVAPLTRLIELGEVDVALVDQSGRPIVADDVHVRLEQVDVGATTPAGPSSTTADPDDKGRVAFRRLPVNAADPTTVDTRYRITGEFPHYDITGAEIRYEADFDHDGAVEPEEVRTDPDFDTAAGIALPVAAGTRMSVTIVVPAFATITGRVQGVVTPPGVPQATVGLNVDNALTIDVTRLDGPRPAAGYTISAVGDRFSVRVPTGRYTLTFRAPNFVRQTTAEIVAETPDAEVRHLPDPVLLQMQRRVVDLTTITELGTAGRPDVTFNGARVRLWWGAVDPLTTADSPLHDQMSVVDGSAVIPGVHPGTYTLLATARDAAGNDLNFPVIGEIVIPPAPEGTTTTVDRKLLMPEVGGSISGTAIATNSLDRRVALPTGLQVTRTYDIAQLGGPGVLPNAADESVLVPAQSPSRQDLVEPTPGAGAPYDFTVLPAGEHEVDFSDIPAGRGFEPVPVGEPAQPVVVQDRNDDVVVDVAYRAFDVPVTVTVTRSTAQIGDANYFITDATVTLSAGENGMFAPGPPNQVTPGVYDFGAVPPDLVGYVLSVRAPGYAVRADTRELIVPSATAQDIAVQLVPLTTIAGIARRQDTQAGPAQAVPDETWVHLIDDTTGLDVAGADVTFKPTGEFTFAFVGGGVYRIVVSDPNTPAAYRRERSAPVADPGPQPGTFDVGTLTAVEFATLTVVVTPPPDPATTNLAITGQPAPVIARTSTGFSVTQLDPLVAYTIAVEHPDYFAEPIVNPAGAVTFDADIGVDYTPAPVVMRPRPATANVTVGPVPEALVDLRIFVNPLPTVTPGSFDGNGHTTVTGLVPGTAYTFTFTARNFEQPPPPVVVTAAPNGQHDVAVTMVPKPASAQVAVTPAPAWTGLALAVTEQPSGTVVPATISTTTGLANVTGLVPGRTYRFAVTATNYQKAPVDVPIVPGNNPVNIAMDPKPAAASITVAGGAAAVPGLTVSIAPANGVTGPNGTEPFAFTGLTANTSYTFTVAATGFITYVSDPFLAPAGGTITQTLTPAALVTFTDSVVNGTAGDTVYLCAAAGACDATTRLDAAPLSAASSSFTFRNLDKGTYRALAFRSAAANDIETFTVDGRGVVTPAALGLALPVPP